MVSVTVFSVLEDFCLSLQEVKTSMAIRAAKNRFFILKCFKIGFNCVVNLKHFKEL